MNGLPLLVDLAAAPVLVVGGGEVAQRRIGELLAAGASISVVAPALTPQLDLWADSGQLRHFPVAFRDDHLDEHWALVIAATADPAVNGAVAQGARGRRLLVNVVSDAGLGNVAFPARVVRGPLQLAFTTGGVAPVLARKLRTLVEALLPEALADFIALAERERPLLKQQGELNQRRRVWERFFDAAWAGQSDPQQALASALAVDDQPLLWLLSPPASVDDLTLRQLRQLQQAERIWTVGDVQPQLLTLCRRDAQISPLPLTLPPPQGAEVALLVGNLARAEPLLAAAAASGWQLRRCGD